MGVFRKNETCKLANGMKVYSYWAAKINAAGSKRRKQFPFDQTGSEVQAALCYNLWRLSLVRTNITINFEQMQKVYLYIIATKKSQDAMIDAVYCSIGGGNFAQSLACKDKGPSTSAATSAPAAAALSASSVAGPSSTTCSSVAGPFSLTHASAAIATNT